MTDRNDRWRRLASELREVKRRLLLPLGLREFFRDRITEERAKNDIKKALDLREERFLELARREIYQRRDSPYMRLLRNAGCDFSDLQACVAQHGLEEALKRLAREGVYFTAEEFK